MDHYRVRLKSITGAATTLAATPRHRSQARVVAVVLINLSAGSSIMVTLVVTCPESIMVTLVVIGPDSNLTSDIVTQLGGGPVTTDN